MHPEIVSGVNFISMSKIYSSIAERATDEEGDGVTGGDRQHPSQELLS